MAKDRIIATVMDITGCGRVTATAVVEYEFDGPGPEYHVYISDIVLMARLARVLMSRQAIIKGNDMYLAVDERDIFRVNNMIFVRSTEKELLSMLK